MLIKQFISVFILSIFSFLIQAQTLEHELHRLIQSYVPMAQVGFIMMEAQTGRILTEYQSQKNFIPASNTKLLSSYAALKMLGPKFQYTTQIYQQENDWVMVFSGDPSLTTENLNNLFEQIKKQGIDTLSGNLIIDDTLFLDEPYATGWMHSDLYWYYAAPITTLTLDQNTIAFSLTPAKTLGDTATLKIENPSRFPGVTFNNHIISVTTEKAEQHCHLNLKINALHYDFSGCWPISESPTLLNIAIQDPKARLTELLAELLKKSGINFNGKIIFKKSKVNNLRRLAEHRSVPLKDLIKIILSDSNNQYANAILKTLGYQTLGEGTFQGGVLATKTLLKSTGIDLKQIQIHDGSGTSYYNLLSPQILVRLLHHIYHDQMLKTVFIDSLPVAGQSGTLKTKLQAQGIQGRIKAKTGSMTGVSNLSGFLKTQAGTDIIFSIMVNGATVNKSILDQFMAEICYLLIFHQPH